MRAKRSRVLIGFHRLGLLVAVPLLVVAMSVAGSAWLSNGGPYVPDPSKTPPLPVTIQPRTTDVTKFTDDELQLARLTEIMRSGNVSAPFMLEVDAGPYRTLAIYQLQRQDKPITGADDPRLAPVMKSFLSFEMNRGVVLLAGEQPIMVGDYLIKEDESKRQYSFFRWAHLKRGFDWQQGMMAGIIGGLAVFFYAFARGLGWVIDGFVTNRETR
jgi:hypothetical protein